MRQDNQPRPLDSSSNNNRSKLLQELQQEESTSSSNNKYSNSRHSKLPPPLQLLSSKSQVYNKHLFLRQSIQRWLRPPPTLPLLAHLRREAQT